MKKAIKFLIILFIVSFCAIVVYLKIFNKETEQKIDLNNIEAQEPSYVKIEKKEKYECNEFNIVNITTENLIRTYFNKYKKYLINNNPEMAYELLDEEYKEKRFGSLSAYKAYVNENVKKITDKVLKRYKIDSDETEYNKYICYDSDGAYYLIKEYAIMDFKIILDTYTLDLPEFLEKYEEANDEGKCALNIQKFFQAINSKDYNYAYNCLADSFKNSYFQSMSDFREYIEKNLYENNEIDFIEYKEKSGLLTYKIEICDNENTDNYSEKTFIIKLNEGTDFELSFNV